MLNGILEGVLSSHSKFLESSKLMIAVSGGSDSMALLHLCSAIPALKFEVATVDHGLRAEAVEEALFVAEHCATLKLKHTTLTWRPEHATSQAARLARYALLVEHAQKIGAGGILLGHTLNDQAETLLMRAQRLKEDSSTRGLSGMPEVASYQEIKLLRPLLKIRREHLRDYLRKRQLAWIDDPSNERMTYERVRLRSALQEDRCLPSIEQICRFAQLSGRHRHWMTPHVSNCIRENVTFDGNTLSLAFTKNIPDLVINEVFLVLILAIGGRDFRVSDRKITDIVAAFQSKCKFRKAVGNCLISVSDQNASFSKELRKSSFFQEIKEDSGEPTSTNTGSTYCPDRYFVKALEYFRPARDDAIFEAISQVHDPKRR